MTRNIPPGFNFWPKQEAALTTPDIIKMYENKLCGVWDDPEATEKFNDTIVKSGGVLFGADAATSSGFADAGAGKLSVPYVFASMLWPGIFPGAGQERGDCVSHDEKNANLISLASEIWAGAPDEVTGKIEIAIEIATACIIQGGFSTEVFYWHRGYDQDGWDCHSSAQVAMTKAGLVPRMNYPDVGIDLSRYSGRLAGKYGRTPPPADVCDAFDDNLIRQATNVQKREVRRDMLFNGNGLSTCGSEGWADTRDENGVSRRKGSWAHALAFSAFDDRPIVHDTYGDSLELVQNSWNKYNRGPRDILDSADYARTLAAEYVIRFGGTIEAALKRMEQADIYNPKTGNLMIPKGSFWALSRDVSRRRVTAKSSVNGWPKRSLLTLGHAGEV